MQGLLEILNSDLGKKVIQGVSGSTHQNQSKTKDLLSLAMPVLTKAMQNNASSPDGAKSLMQALESKHDGAILSNLDQVFQGQAHTDSMQDGQKILGHILGGKQSNVIQTLSKQVGLDSSSASSILQTAAPILMGIIGKQKSQSNIQDSSQLTNILGGLIQGSSNTNSRTNSILQSILDADNDGSIVDDVAELLLGNNQKKGFLARLFKR